TTADCPLQKCRAGLPYSVPHDNSHQPTRRRWRYRILCARVAPPASRNTGFECSATGRFQGKDLKMLTLHVIELGSEPVTCSFHLAVDFCFRCPMTKQSGKETMGMKV